ncbi:MAG TPA: Lsr2 family protein [Arthrobacter sp.]
MAQKVIMTLTDDLDGGDAAETVRFSLDGNSFEMELNEANAAELREILSPYKTAGRKTPGARTARQSVPNTESTGVRKWAAENGIKVSPRGRVSEEILQRYAAAQS